MKFSFYDCVKKFVKLMLRLGFVIIFDILLIIKSQLTLLKFKIMSYTIVGMFPNNEDLDTVANQLNIAGFPAEDYHVSRYSTSALENQTSRNYDFKEDEKTTGFWNWLFGDNEDDRSKYSYAGSKSNIVTVYTDDMDRAEKARQIMDYAGAINVNEFTKERYPDTSEKSTELSEKEVQESSVKQKTIFISQTETASTTLQVTEWNRIWILKEVEILFKNHRI